MPFITPKVKVMDSQKGSCLIHRTKKKKKSKMGDQETENNHSNKESKSFEQFLE